MIDLSQRWPLIDLKVRLWSGYGQWNEGKTYGGFPEKSSQIKEKAAWEGLFGPIHLFLLEMLRCEIVQLGAAAVFRVLWKETLHAHQRSNTERLKEQGPQWHFWAFETLWDNLFPVLEVPFKCYLENVHRSAIWGARGISTRLSKFLRLSSGWATHTVGDLHSASTEFSILDGYNDNPCAWS